jgi:hypothetical protein
VLRRAAVLPSPELDEAENLLGLLALANVGRSRPTSDKPISPLRQRMLEDMAVRQFGQKTQADYIRHVETVTAFLGLSRGGIAL